MAANLTGLLQRVITLSGKLSVGASVPVEPGDGPLLDFSDATNSMYLGTV